MWHPAACEQQCPVPGAQNAAHRHEQLFALAQSAAIYLPPGWQLMWQPALWLPQWYGPLALQVEQPQLHVPAQ
jgi:hypothetical protein